MVLPQVHCRVESSSMSDFLKAHFFRKRPTRTVLTLGSPELGQAFVAKTIADVAQEVAAL
jgi:hypothetical protein